MPGNKLVDRVIDISQEYLGPAAERFVHRQITSHLGKKPDDLTTNDLGVLIDWLKLSFALMTDNGRLVEDYAKQLNTLEKARS
jgi:hypothetical protein